MLRSDLARIRRFEVIPSLPVPLRPLLEIAHNLAWSWSPDAADLFVRLDRELWEQKHHNPVAVLGAASQDRLDAAAQDEGFRHSLERVVESFEQDRDRKPWHVAEGFELPGQPTIAYFCAEFGLAECLQIYSGGLGCLAGDHLKSASELG
ncbi:MAG: DUF3417 domain-containing protein, partial [Planctomycetota bacterium]